MLIHRRSHRVIGNTWKNKNADNVRTGLELPLSHTDDDNTTAYEEGVSGEQRLSFSLTWTPVQKMLTCVIHAVDAHGAFAVDPSAEKFHVLQLRGVPSVPAALNATTGRGNVLWMWHVRVSRQ